MSANRICIKCGETLRPVEVAGVEVDYCAGCGGIWLDEGEIRALAARPAETLHEIRAIDHQIADFHPTDPGLSAGLLDKPCPACGGKLTHATFGNTGVEHCNACHGIFVDRGELEKAMQLAQSNAATTIVALARSVETSGTL